MEQGQRHFLHIIRRPGERQALEIAARQGQGEGVVTILMIQAGMVDELPPGVKGFVLQDDAGSPGLSSRCEAVDYGGMLDLILAANWVTCW